MREARATFTLVELMAVLVIISLLAAMLLPALQKARASAHQVACAGQQKQIYQIVDLYCDDNAGFYPKNIPYFSSAFWPTTKTWFYIVGPYFGYKDAIGIKEKLIFQCPAWNRAIANLSRETGFTGNKEDYMSCGGIAYSFYYIWTTWGFYRKRIIMQRFMIIQHTDSADRYNFGRGTAAPDVGGYTGRYHNGGANYIFTDGHYQWSNAYWDDSQYKSSKLPYAPCLDFPKNMP